MRALRTAFQACKIGIYLRARSHVSRMLPPRNTFIRRAVIVESSVPDTTTSPVILLYTVVKLASAVCSALLNVVTVDVLFAMVLVRKEVAENCSKRSYKLLKLKKNQILHNIIIPFKVEMAQSSQHYSV